MQAFALTCMPDARCGFTDNVFPCILLVVTHRKKNISHLWENPHCWPYRMNEFVFNKPLRKGLTFPAWTGVPGLQDSAL